MKRHPALAELSRDHHRALVVARGLRHVTSTHTAGAARRFLAFWTHDCQDHFRQEEGILLLAYAVHGAPDHPDVVQMLADHMIIRRDAQLVAGGASAAELWRLGQRLADHVRLEERRIFPLVEATLSVSELHRLGDRLTAATT